MFSLIKVIEEDKSFFFPERVSPIPHHPVISAYGGDKPLPICWIWMTAVIYHSLPAPPVLRHFSLFPGLTKPRMCAERQVHRETDR